MKITNKLILSFIIIIAVFTAGLFYGLSATKSALIDQVSGNAITFASDITDRLDQEVNSAMVELSIIAAQPGIQNFVIESNMEYENIDDIPSYLETKEQEWYSFVGKDNPIFNEMVQNSLSQRIERARQEIKQASGIDAYPEILVTNKHGATLGENNRLTDWDQSDRLQFTNTRDNGYHVGDLYYDNSASIWALEVAVPIRDHDRNFAGMIKVAYNIDDIIDILLDSAEESPYENAATHLLTKDGRVIYSTFEDFSLGDQVPAELIQLFTNKDGSFPFTIDGENKRVAYAKSDGFRDYPGLEWVVIISIPEKEFLGEVDTIQNVLMGVLITSIVIAVVTSILTTKAFSRPITKLTYSMQEIGKGNFDAKVDVKTKDEISEIGIIVNDLANKLKLSEQQKNEFAAMITHELKTPLVPIQGYCEMLKNPKFGPLNEDQKDAVDEILINSKQLLGLIQNVLNAQKLEAQGIKYNMETFDVDEFIANVMKTLEHYTTQKNITFTESVEKGQKIKGDKNRLMEVFNNLVANAVDFTPADTGKIHIDGKVIDNMIQFSVADNGIGIPKDKQKGMFQKFFQVDTSATRKHGGSGLGLAICKGYVTDHGGKIWLESEEGKGSTFLFTLPLSE